MGEVIERHWVCDVCGRMLTGPDGWCPDCSLPLYTDEWDDTGGDPDPGMTEAERLNPITGEEE